MNKTISKNILWYLQQTHGQRNHTGDRRSFWEHLASPDTVTCSMYKGVGTFGAAHSQPLRTISGNLPFCILLQLYLCTPRVFHPGSKRTGKTFAIQCKLPSNRLGLYLLIPKANTVNVSVWSIWTIYIYIFFFNYICFCMPLRWR